MLKPCRRDGDLSKASGLASRSTRGDTHVQFLHGAGSHAGTLEVDEGTESLMQHSDALDLAVSARQDKQVRGAEFCDDLG